MLLNAFTKDNGQNVPDVKVVSFSAHVEHGNLIHTLDTISY